MSQNFDLGFSDTGTDLELAISTMIKEAFEALVTGHSGATAPTTTYAYMVWNDTATGARMIRNAADSAWLALGPLQVAQQIVTRVDLGAVSATTTFRGVLLPPSDLVVVGCALYSDTADTGTSGNEWQFKLTNLTQTEELFSGTVGTFTTLGGVGGGALVADTGYELLADQNATIAKLDALDFTMTKLGTATTLAEAQLIVYGYQVAA